MNLLRTHSSNADFVVLVKRLDAELAERDGADHAFYSQFNKIPSLRYVVVGSEDGIPVACGALKEMDSSTIEVKRMFVSHERRGRGLAALVLKELEKWAKELGYKVIRLETGQRQPEAIRLYEKTGYTRIPNYGQYVGVENSVCFGKVLTY